MHFLGALVGFFAALPPGPAGDDPVDGETTPAAPEPAPARATHPVAFDKKWLQPFFASGTALPAAAEKFRREDWTGAAEAFAAALVHLPKSSPDFLPARFLLASARMNLSAWSDAGALFEDLWTTYPILAPYHAYNAARCRLRRGDTAGALEWVARVPPGSAPAPESVLIKLDAIAAMKNWAELEIESARYLERYAAGPRRAEAMFHRAEALEGLGRPVDEIAAAYRRIWAEAPADSWGSRAAERLEALARPLPTEAAARIKVKTASEWITRGMVLFDRNQNAESEATFAVALTAEGGNPALTCRAAYHRAQSVWKQRQRPRAAPLFAEAVTACQAAGDSDLLVKSLYQGGRCLATMGNRPAALANYARIEAEHPAHSYADDARLRAAEIATDEGKDEEAAAVLAELPIRYPKGDLVGEALWRLALRSIRAGAWDKAQKSLDENLRRLPHEDIWYAEGRALYWKARAFEKQSRTADATTFYTRAVREYPLSVYALFSLERLRRVAPGARQKLLGELHGGDGKNKAQPWAFSPRPVFAEPGFLRAVELARMGLGTDARRELTKLGLSAPDSRDAARKAAASTERDDALWIGAVLLDRGRVWSASHSIPRYALTSYRHDYPAGRGDAEWRISYPRAFPEIVGANCRANNVPEALQLAIMREESAFNPRIESFANALGLTQMIVKTAQRFCPTKVTRDTLLDPAKNVEVGSRFLSFLLEHFNKAVPLAISGYNAGEAAVDRWLRERGDVELDEFIETIPFDETRNYTKRVLASYFAYSWLYATGKPVPVISFSLKPAPTRPKTTRAGRRAGR